MCAASRKTVSRRYGKYGAKRTVYRGVTYDSKSEAAYAAYLDRAVKAGLLVGWERQKPIVLVVNGVKVCKMIADFLVHERGGVQRYVEVKGVRTAAYNLKLKLLKALHPDLPYSLVSAKEALSL